MKITTFKMINGEMCPIIIDCDEEEIIKDTRTYNEKVVSYIRERYSLDEELAVQRQRYSKPQEFQEYFNYCEECKRKAKQI